MAGQTAGGDCITFHANVVSLSVEILSRLYYCILYLFNQVA